MLDMHDTINSEGHLNRWPNLFKAKGVLTNF
jgi:hypothetical protein